MDLTNRYVNLVEEGYDVALRGGRAPEGALTGRPLGQGAVHLVASPAYIAANGAPDTPDQMAQHEALMQGTEPWQFLDGDEVVTIRPQGRFKADNGTALAVAAIAGLGVAWLPDAIVEEHVANGTLQVVMPRYPPPSAGIYVIRPPGRHPSRKVRVLTELLIECFDQAPHLDRIRTRA